MKEVTETLGNYKCSAFPVAFKQSIGCDLREGEKRKQFESGGGGGNSNFSNLLGGDGNEIKCIPTRNVLWCPCGLTQCVMCLVVDLEGEGSLFLILKPSGCLL